MLTKFHARLFSRLLVINNTETFIVYIHIHYTPNTKTVQFYKYIGTL